MSRLPPDVSPWFIDSYRFANATHRLTFDTPTILRHPHPRFLVIMGKDRVDRRSHDQHNNSCPFKPLRELGVDYHDGEMGCAFCWNRSCYMYSMDFMELANKSPVFKAGAKTYRCNICDMGFCDSCIDSRVKTHPHELITMHLKEPSPPEDFWKKLLDGSCRWCDLCKGYIPIFGRTISRDITAVTDPR
jgi:hypothetical protein